ncbi:hypothetical protein CSB45_05210 [candidate division KSB3 bacterium]|uniref:Uncharacterized protein n=1 Tax=candidate division KSB3 bacterium TaxID=2044937 RepID=A0A2G6E7J9_9BACT|nr:MAG: hypothetical protein CSB45_05210 [candidate division KSB3 bacterium]PIE30450.1 MAG: hypothetical protein CSA57_03975 [candidate division KSB3 bacterium]
MKKAFYVLKVIVCTLAGFGWITVAIPYGSNAVLAIEIGAGAQATQQYSTVPVTGEIAPGVPGREERPIPSSQPDSRAILAQPRQVQKRWADSYLPQSVRNVTDPQDGLRKDDRVAVLEGINSQIVYTFHTNNKIINLPNQPDFTIYTHDKGGFDGPYNVFTANFGEADWTQVGADVMGTASFDLPSHVQSAELILIDNRHNGATYIEAIEGSTLAAAVGGTLQGGFSYFPEHLIGLRVDRLDCAELEEARMAISAGGRGYQLCPLGEIEVQWNTPISNEWKTEEFHIEADGEYDIFAGDSRGMENFIGRRAGSQSIDLPQNMVDAAKVRIRNHNSNRPLVIYAIVGRR